MSAADWQVELHALAVRFSGYGVGPDLVCLTLAQAWGLFVFLRRVAARGDGDA